MNKNRYKLSIRKDSYFLIYSVLLVVCFLLFLRDVYSLGISKYLFIALLGIYIMMTDINQFFVLLCFIMPIYVGLPGNYLTFIIFIKFLYLIFVKKESFGFNIFTFLTGILFSLFILIQNYILGYTGTYYFMPCVEIIIVLFLFSYKGNKIDYKQCIFMFSLSVAFLGIVLFISTVRIYGFAQMLNMATRLGTVMTNKMTLRIDPNYYGYFTIASLSCGWILLFTEFPKNKKIILLIAIILSIFVSISGLSRTFILVLTLWIFVICIFQKNKLKVFTMIGSLLAIILVILYFFPNIANVLIQRFSSTDMVGGNGRMEANIIWFSEWRSSFKTLLLGVGLFKVTAHCMPVQYLTGTGVLGGLLISLFFISIIYTNYKHYDLKKISCYLPLLFCLIESLTIPIAQSLTFMFPILISILVTRIDYSK